MKKIIFFVSLMASSLGFSQPTTSAPVPPVRSSSDVVSIYGDSYTNITGVNYNPGWAQSGTVDIAYNPGDGNLCMAYTNFNYQGTGFEANAQNASAMEYLHVDIWVATGTDRLVKVSPISPGDTPVESLVVVPLTPGSWNSVDLPKSAFGGMAWNNITQLKFDGQFNGDGSANTTPFNIYLDNIYFWKTATATGTDATLSNLQVDGTTVTGFTPSAYTYSVGVAPGSAIPQITGATTTDAAATITSTNQATAIPGSATVNVTAANGTTTATYTVSFYYNAPATPAPDPTETNVISLFSGVYTNVPVTSWNTSWSQATYEEIQIAGNPTKKYTNVGFNGIETTSNPINAGTAGMTHVNVDIWSPNMTSFNLKLVSFLGDGYAGANGDSEASVVYPVTQGTWQHLHIPLADFTAAGLTSLNDIEQIIFTSTPFGTGTLYLDNLYFSSDVMAINQVSANNMVVYPNPVRSGEFVSIPFEVNSVEIYNMKGQLISKTNTNTVDTSSLNTGIYMVKAIDTNGVSKVSKLMIK